MSSMFTAKRYATRGVSAGVGLDIQLLLWAMIDHRKKKGIKVDYLQVFELAIVNKGVQKVVHRQKGLPVSDIYYLAMMKAPGMSI